MRSTRKGWDWATVPSRLDSNVGTKTDSGAVLSGPGMGGDGAYDALLRSARFAVPVLIISALALRLAYYVRSPSLSTDEASLALNLTHHSYSGLFTRLDFNQAAPPGFLLLQKLTVDVLGQSVYALRLLPFLAGAAACLLIYPIATRMIGRQAAVIALALFAVNDALVSYSSTNKQYSFDVAVVLVLLSLTLAARTRLGMRETLMLAIGGVIAVFVSHPAAFMLAAIGTVLLIERVATHRWLEAARVIGISLVWLVSFVAAYLLTRASIKQIQHSVAGQSDAHSSGHGTDAVQTAGGVIRSVLGIPNFTPAARAAIALVAIVLCVAGFIMLILRNPGTCALIVAPAILATLAAWINWYPSFPRTFLFSAPSLILLIASGTQLLPTRRLPKVVGAGALLAVVIILGVTAFRTLDHLHGSDLAEPTRALTYLVDHARASDALYVSRPAQYSFRYYMECGCFANSRTVLKARKLWPVRPSTGHQQFAAALRSAPPRFVAGSSAGFDKSEYDGDLASLLRRKRVWIFAIDLRGDAKRALTSFLRKNGRIIDVFPRGDNAAAASVFLYSGIDSRG